MSGQEAALAERYGGSSVARRRAVVAGSVLIAAVFLGWLVWAIWLNADPKVTSQLQSFDVQDDHAVTAILQVHQDSGATDVRCTLTALATDHTVVGELPFTPDPAAGEQQRVTIRTDRRATTVNSAGCTADGQDRPR